MNHPPRPVNIVPRPARSEALPGEFRLPPNLEVFVGPEADLAGDALFRAISAEHTVAGSAEGADISLVVDDRLGGSGSYRLRVMPEAISIVGADAAGVFHGVQTLRQLLPPAEPVPADSSVPCVLVDDAPRLPRRGFMLDVARHFFPTAFILRLIDLLALHKLNVLHLHLTDDQGWRLDVPDYPRLAEVAAWRSETVVGVDYGIGPVVGYDGLSHGGCYSRAHLQQIVEYAAARFIDVVPEIDMPGHMQAAIAAYPHLGLAEERVEVRRRWGISDHVLRLDERSLEFCRGVLAEVFRVFPSPFVHCGGDEVPKHRWVRSPEVQQLVRKLELPNTRALQAWFTAHIAEFLVENDRRMIGWDDVLDAGSLRHDIVIMAWRDAQKAVQGAEAGHDVLMAPRSAAYLDVYQSEDVDNEPLSFPRRLTLRTVYDHDPVPRALAEAGLDGRVLGTQAQLWSEYVATPEDAEYKLFPRLTAFAETAWRRPGALDYPEFLVRLDSMLARLDALGVRYRPVDEETAE